MKEKSQSGAWIKVSAGICLAYAEILVKDKDAHGGEVSRGVTNEKGGRGNGHSCVRRKLYTHMCDEAGLDICINKHGDEVRVGSVDVLDKEQVDVSKHGGQCRRCSRE
ncbi:uncharacterized protein LOC125520285 isoform X1 [Triticum urartu]|uniref:Uncharacterized protein n=1 Tax=Triticum urartu TaxID=4572 RepID=A0A8R7V2X4_TRIUA|nr:uncharacterized protein LOC125520285 isoform X1 [Triticum urartu]